MADQEKEILEEEMEQDLSDAEELKAVSYTHLTLPTNSLV